MWGKDTALFFKWSARFAREMSAPISRGAEKTAHSKTANIGG